MDNTFEKAVKTVTRVIKNDKELFESYKANIAMAFKDEFAKAKIEKNYINSDDLHKIANNATKNFLDLWCRS